MTGGQTARDDDNWKVSVPICSFLHRGNNKFIHTCWRRGPFLCAVVMHTCCLCAIHGSITRRQGQVWALNLWVRGRSVYVLEYKSNRLLGCNRVQLIRRLCCCTAHSWTAPVPFLLINLRKSICSFVWQRVMVGRHSVRTTRPGWAQKCFTAQSLKIGRKPITDHNIRKQWK
jgi:hypothetical protein